MEFLVIIGIWGIVVALAPIGVWNAKSRLTRLENQVRHLEQKIASLTGAGIRSPAPAPSPAPTASTASEPFSQAYRPAVATPLSKPQPMPRSVDTLEFAPTPRPTMAAPPPTPAPQPQTSEQPAPSYSSLPFTAQHDAPAGIPSALAGWITYGLTGGRLFVTLGLGLLFIGVAMLLTYVAHTITIPLEMRFAGIALAACGLIAFGHLQIGKRREFGLYLQGGGLGILFLTVFTAFKFYSLLPSGAAFVLLALIGAATFGLSMLYDALPLALMAVTGGFMAPLITSTGHGDPAELFSYYLLINLVIFAIAWRKSWRVLNMIGFGFTFVIGLIWGGRYYEPYYYPTVQTFLIAYFLLYTGMGMLYAARSAPRLTHPIEGSSVFGVPLIGFGLQVVLVRHFTDGASFSALALGAFYAFLFLALRRNARPGLLLLGDIYGWMALLFVTLAAAVHFDMHIAAPLWAMEGATMLWMLNRARHWLYGIAGLALLGLGNILMLKCWSDGFFFTQLYIPMGLMALTHFAASRLLTQARAFFMTESRLDQTASLIGIGWWLFAGLGEIADAMPRNDHTVMPMLLFFTLSAAAAWATHRRFAVALLDKPMAFLLPVTLAAALFQFLHDSADYHPAMDYGFAALPAAFAAHYAWLTLRDEAARPWQHMLGYIAVTVLAGLELGYWLNRLSPGEAERSCGAIIAAAAGIGLLTTESKNRFRPLAAMTQATLSQTLLALALWMGMLCLYSFTLPVEGSYIPLLNVVELSELAAAAILLRMAGRVSLPLEDQSLLRLACGLMAFAFINCVALRIAAHLLYQPYLSDAMFAAPAVQTLLTILWAVTAMGLMLASSQNRLRLGWSAGAVLLGIVVLKLFFVDLANTGTLSRIVSFLGVGGLTLAMGYIAPMPPKENT